jgi:hypothetical protein
MIKVSKGGLINAFLLQDSDPVNPSTASYPLPVWPWIGWGTNAWDPLVLNIPSLPDATGVIPTMTVPVYNPVTLQQEELTVGDLQFVPIDSTTALVNNQWNDLTGVVWDASKPFLTPEAARLAVWPFWTIILQGNVTGNVWAVWAFFNIVFNDATLIWDVTWLFVFIKWTVQDPYEFNNILQGNIHALILSVSWLSTFTGNISGQNPWDTVWYQIRNCYKVQNSWVIIWDWIGRCSWVIDNVSNLSCYWWTIVSDSTVNDASYYSTVISWVRYLNCSQLQVGLWSDWELIIENCPNLFIDNGLHTWVIDSARKVQIKNSYFSWLQALDVSWTGSIDMFSYNSVYEIANAEAITRATDPAGAVTLKSSSLLSKPRNTTWVVNQIVTNDLVDSNITIV